MRVAFVEFSSDPCEAVPAPHGAVIRFVEAVAPAGAFETLRDIFRRVVRLAKDDNSRIGKKPCRGTIYRAPTVAAIEDHACLIAGRAGQRIDESAAARRIAPHLERRVE